VNESFRKGFATTNVRAEQVARALRISDQQSQTADLDYPFAFSDIAVAEDVTNWRSAIADRWPQEMIPLRTA
jgi:hypothetical protein